MERGEKGLSEALEACASSGSGASSLRLVMSHRCHVIKLKKKQNSVANPH